MALKLNEKQVGLSLGLLFAVLNAAWMAMVGAGFGQAFVNWKMGIHFISGTFTVTALNIFTAATGILFAFVIGAIMGWLFAKIWNWLPQQKWYKQL